jgi:ketosteroid isomerase-like protein
MIGLAVLACAGCASIPSSQSSTADAQKKTQIQLVLNQVIDACEKKELNRLDSYHLYGPRFTKFDIVSALRLDAASARQGEHNGLTAAKDLRMQAEDLDIEVFGKTDIASLILSYSFTTGNDRIQRRARTTLVFVKHAGSWKIVHEHLSAATTQPTQP